MSASTINIISWNVNGLRAVMKKGFDVFIEAQQPTVLCLQEIKVQEDQVERTTLPFPHQYYHSAEKKGYSGTATLSELEPLAVDHDELTGENHGHEGRVQILEFEKFFLVNVYVPNSKDGLKRLDYRTQEFDPSFREVLQELDCQKPLVACGDFNVAHQEIDIARPKDNKRSAGFTDEERGEFSRHLEAGFLDIWRTRNPDATDCYTWWSMRAGARGRNVGWRIDYFLVSERLAGAVSDAYLLPDVYGSDHCPIGLRLDLAKL